MQHTGRRFENEVVVLDNGVFIDCIFSDCVIEYSGGPFVISGWTQFLGKWVVRFCGDTRNTAMLILFLAKGMGMTLEDHFDLKTPLESHANDVVH